MGIGNLVLLSQVTLYLLSFILSFFAFVPVSVHHSSFGGHCALFSNATPNFSAVAHDQYDIIWASNNSCNYAIFIGVFVMLISVVQIWRMSVFILKDIDSSFLSAFVDMMAGVTVTIMLFACAILVTKGLNAWCNSITTDDRSCYALSAIPSIIAGIATSGFYIQLAITRFGLWCLWVLWVLLTTAASLKIMKYHKEENIMISLRREKQHLLAANVTKTSASTDAFPEI